MPRTPLLAALALACVDPDPGGGPDTDAVLDGTDRFPATDGPEAESDRPAPQDTAAPPPCDTAAVTTATRLHGTLRWDDDRSARSSWQQVPTRGDGAWADAAITLRGPGGAVHTTRSCLDGTWTAPDGLAAGPWHVAVDLGPDDVVTSKDLSLATARAIDDGALTVVTLGDSVAVYGDDPTFPELLPDALTDVVTVDSRNLAVSGSKSVDWLPETARFRDTVVPALADAEVVLITLGGNDFNVADLLQDGQILQAGVQFQQRIREATANVRRITSAIHDEAPHVDVLYYVYLNYPRTPEWGAELGLLQGTVAAVFSQALGGVRDSLSEDPALLVADLDGATRGAPLDGLLQDPLHPNAAGHRVYLAETLRGLGFVSVTADDTVAVVHSLDGPPPTP